jgi:hypothetical protein
MHPMIAAYGQITAASFSMLISFALVVGIFSSENGLKSPYRRLIFGFCLCESILSLTLILAPYGTVRSDSSPLGRGNHGTCAASGFIFNFFCSESSIYIWALTYYHFCKLARGMTDAAFSARKEWMIHVGATLYAFAYSIPGLLTDSIKTHSFGTFCAVATDNPNCRQDSELECLDAKKVTILETMNSICLTIILLGIGRNSCYMLWYVRKRDRAFGVSAARTSYLRRRNWVSSISSRSDDSDSSADEDALNTMPRIGLEVEELEGSQPGSKQLESERIRSTMAIQACLYTLAYMFSYSPYYIWWIIMNNGDMATAQCLHLFISITYPLSGFFHILVFTRPSVWILRKKHNYCWIQAFVRVISAGGTIPPPKKREISSPRSNDICVPLRGSNIKDDPNPESSLMLVGSAEAAYNTSDREMSLNNACYLPRNEWQTWHHQAPKASLSLLQEISEVSDLSCSHETSDKGISTSRGFKAAECISSAKKLPAARKHEGLCRSSPILLRYTHN